MADPEGAWGLAPPPRWQPGNWSFSSFNVSYELVSFSFIILVAKWPHLTITSILWKRPSNGEQITGNSSSFRHCQKSAKLCFSAPPDPVAASKGFLLLRGGGEEGERRRLLHVHNSLSATVHNDMCTLHLTFLSNYGQNGSGRSTICPRLTNIYWTRHVSHPKRTLQRWVG